MAPRRKDHFEDKLGAENPNVALPSYIAASIVDSPYFTRFLGNDLSEAHDTQWDAQEQARALQKAAADKGAPLAELRAVVDAMRPQQDMRPFEGQTAHEARAANLDLTARLEQQRVGMANIQNLAFSARAAQNELARGHSQHGQGIADMREQLAKLQRRYKRNFAARAESSSASEPGAEPRGRSR